MSITNDTLTFLSDLKKNNEREWFQKNKKRFEVAKAEFENFLHDLIPMISDFDKEIASVDIKKSIFRIYRDTRFSNDKSPYQTYLGAHLIAGGRGNEHGKSGYYIRLEPGNTFLAGGAYLPPSSWINSIRNEIANNAKDFKNIINNVNFMKLFGELEGESLKSAPRGFPKDHPEIELLKRKSFLAVHRLDDKELTNKDFIYHVQEVFRTMYPFGQFLNKASII